jgi:ADP-ribose pyrophosphatase
VDAEHEDIKVHVISRKQAMEMLEDGRICNAVAIIGLQWLDSHYKELQKRWSDK